MYQHLMQQRGPVRNNHNSHRLEPCETEQGNTAEHGEEGSAPELQRDAVTLLVGRGPAFVQLPRECRVARINCGTCDDYGHSYAADGNQIDIKLLLRDERHRRLPLVPSGH